MVVFDVGWDMQVLVVIFDCFCGFGIMIVNMGVVLVMFGMEDCVVFGGVEMMFYIVIFKGGMMDQGNMYLCDLYLQWYQGICVDVIVMFEGISCEDVDGFVYESQ